MFKHGKTGQIYYSVREKINYYSKRAYNNKSISPAQKQHALNRLAELKAIDSARYDEPTMIVTNDRRLGNGIDKPRACVVLGEEEKKRLVVSPVYDRTVKAVILDNDYTRQVDSVEKRIDRSEVYELKYIDGLMPLTENDKRKIRYIHAKK